MADYGLLATGFAPKPLNVIREEINEELRTVLGASIDLSDNSALGQIVGILAERYAIHWELEEEIYGAFDPLKASGAALDALAAITGTVRQKALPSTVTLYLTGDPATAIAAGSRASTTSTGIVFQTKEAVTLAAATAWATTTAYTVGDVVTNNGNVYYCSTAGTSAGSGGPSGTGTAESDNTAAWDYLGDGTAYVTVSAEAVETGPQVAAARDITTIDTAVSGWDSVINTADATLGRDLETDEALRARRRLDLAAAGNGPLDALRSDLLGVDGVTVVKLFANTTDTTDSDGVPPHSIEAVVIGGEDQDIFDQLLASVCWGIGIYGSTTGTATDSEGVEQDVAFSRPTEVNIWIDIELIKDPNSYPANGDDQIKEALEAYGASLAIGKDIVSSALKGQCFSVPGVLDVTLAEVGTSDPPTAETTITITSRQLAKIAAARITVDSTTDGTP